MFLFKGLTTKQVASKSEDDARKWEAEASKLADRIKELEEQIKGSGSPVSGGFEGSIASDRLCPLRLPVRLFLAADLLSRPAVPVHLLVLNAGAMFREVSLSVSITRTYTYLQVLY